MVTDDILIVLTSLFQLKISFSNLLIINHCLVLLLERDEITYKNKQKKQQQQQQNNNNNNKTKAKTKNEGIS